MRGRKPEFTAIDGGLARVPRAPSWLSLEAREEWTRVVPELVKRRVLTNGDRSVLEAYCLAIGIVRRAQTLIGAEGDMIATEQGPRRHPAFQTLFQALTESRRLAAELGLTPASRNKASAMKGEDDDDFASLGI